MTWTDIILPTLRSIPFAPYARDDSEGVSESIFWQGKRILRANTPSTSMCVGAVAELLFKSLKRAGLEGALTPHEAIRVKQHLFVYDDDSHYDGVAGALVLAGLADWVHSPEESQPGDFCQLWDHLRGEETFGHSFVVTGQTQNRSGDPAVSCWSSDNYSNDGHGFDYFSHYHPDPPRQRTFYIARLRQDLL